MSTAPCTLLALQEATVRTTRSGDDAFASAALGARTSTGKKATVYVDPKGRYSYGIQSQKTGGKTTPMGAQVVGDVVAGMGGTAEIRRRPKKGRMKQQLARIERSSQLSPEERESYQKAAKAKGGRVALPAGAASAVSRGSFGIKTPRKIAAVELAKKRPAKVRTIAALQDAGGAVKSAAERDSKRKRREAS